MKRTTEIPASGAWRARVPRAVLALAAVLVLLSSGRAWAAEEVVTVFEDVPVRFQGDAPETAELGGLILREKGRIVERTIDLPPLPTNMRDARRIVAVIEVRPKLMRLEDERVRPGDLWTRRGSLLAVWPEGLADPEKPDEAELVRFVTGFGGVTRHEQDITSLAPLLDGETTLKIFIDTWADPGWEVSVRLEYHEDGVGYRRPVFAEPAYWVPEMTAGRSRVRADVVVPPGLAQPRLRVLSTGHSTVGRGANEFITSPHVLRIDGQIIAVWRPWREDGGLFRERSPASGRAEIDGRELWSSDLDRSGWVPGVVVQPLILPVPELSAGRHAVELEVEGIRPGPDDKQEGYGYWVESAIIVADEPWPTDEPESGSASELERD